MRLLRKAEVCARTGLSGVTIWRKEKDGDFPPRVQVSTQVVAWVEEEVDRWIASRARGIPAPPVNIPTPQVNVHERRKRPSGRRRARVQQQIPVTS